MYKKLLVFLVFLAVVLVLPDIVFAQTVASIAASVVNSVWIVGTAIVIIMWIVTGLLFLTGLGDPSRLNKARIALLASIAGTALVIIAYGAMSLVSSAIGV